MSHPVFGFDNTAIGGVGGVGSVCLSANEPISDVSTLYGLAFLLAARFLDSAET